MRIQETPAMLNYTFSPFDAAVSYSGALVIKILDIQGKLAKTVKETLSDGVQKLCVNVEDLKKGSYVMNIFNDFGFVKSIRYIKN